MLIMLLRFWLRCACPESVLNFGTPGRVQAVLPPYCPVRVSLVSVPLARIVRPFVSVTRGETCSAGFFQLNAGWTYTVTLRVVPTVNPSAATQFAFTCEFNWKIPRVTRFAPTLSEEVIVLASGKRLL